MIGQPSRTNSPHPSTDDPEWQEYLQSQKWRKEPEIPNERKLQLEEWKKNADPQNWKYPFGGKKLTRADIEYLLVTHNNGQGPVDWSCHEQRDWLGLDLRGADLQGLDLSYLPLTGLIGGLEQKIWVEATVEERELAAIDLQRTYMKGTHLEGASLRSAHLENAYLRDAYLEKAYLRYTHFEGTSLKYAYLAGANLGGALFNVASQLDGIHLNNKYGELNNKYGEPPRLGGVQWDGTNLTYIDWSQIEIIDDEIKARESKDRDTGKLKSKDKRLKHYSNAAHAYRQLAIVLQSQGLNEEANRFTYHGKLMQRKVLWWEKNWLAWLFSWILNLVAGYGYKPLRFLIAAILISLFFGIIYFILGLLSPTHLTVVNAFVTSVQYLLTPDFKNLLANVQGTIGAIEGLFGIFIAAILIAIVTNRILNK